MPSSCVVMSGSECRTMKAAVCVILALVFFLFSQQKSAMNSSSYEVSENLPEGDLLLVKVQAS